MLVVWMRKCLSRYYGSFSCRLVLWSTHTCPKTESQANIKVSNQITFLVRVLKDHQKQAQLTVFGTFSGYGFVEFLSEEDADYAIKIMNMIKLYGKPIRVNKASAHNKNLDVGANIFIGNLDPEIDEKLLYDTFSAFGVILQTPKIMRDPDTGNSKGYAFINFASFDASDAAIEAMNGQYLCNRPITVSYAFKKDSKGERHGSAAERLLAAQNPLSQADRPHQLFADAPPPPTAPTPVLTTLGAAMAIPGKRKWKLFYCTDLTVWVFEHRCGVLHNISCTVHQVMWKNLVSVNKKLIGGDFK